jgi:hypothetical protein
MVGKGGLFVVRVTFAALIEALDETAMVACPLNGGGKIVEVVTVAASEAETSARSATRAARNFMCVSREAA